MRRMSYPPPSNQTMDSICSFILAIFWHKSLHTIYRLVSYNVARGQYTYSINRWIRFAVNCMLEMLKDVFQSKVTLVQLILEVPSRSTTPIMLPASARHSRAHHAAILCSLFIVGADNWNGFNMLSDVHPVDFVDATLHNNHLGMFKWKGQRLHRAGIECRRRESHRFNCRIRGDHRQKHALSTHFSIFITIFFGHFDVSTTTWRAFIVDS